MECRGWYIRSAPVVAWAVLLLKWRLKRVCANKDKDINTHKNRHDGRRGKKHNSRPWLVESVRSLYVSICPRCHSLFDAFFVFVFFSDANSLSFPFQYVETLLFWKIIPWPIIYRNKRVSSHDLQNKLKQACLNIYLALFDFAKKSASCFYLIFSF